MDTTGDEIGPFVDRREMRQEALARRGSITRKTDIEIVVEDRERIEERDEEMSDADSEGGEEDEYEAADETAALEEHISELSRRRQHSINNREQDYNRRIIAAWEQGVALTPELENYLKEQTERGTLPLSMGLGNILRRSSGGYQPLTSPTSPTVASRAAA